MIETADHTTGLPVASVTPPKAVTLFDKKVFCSLISMKQTHPATAFCFAQLLDKRRTSSTLCFGDSFVAHSRNSIADAFLNTDCEYLFSLDDDMIVPFGAGGADWYRAYTTWDWYPDPFAGFNTLDRLISHRKSVVGGLYFGRYRYGPPVFAEGGNVDMAKLARKSPINEIRKTNWVGTGAILIHRQVFLDIEKKFPQLGRGLDGKGGQWFTSSEHGVMQDLEKLRAMLGTGAMDGPKAFKAYEMVEGMMLKSRQSTNLGVGEDVIFCRRAREAGHEVFVDLGLVAGHVGYACYGPRNTTQRP